MAYAAAAVAGCTIRPAIVINGYPIHERANDVRAMRRPPGYRFPCDIYTLALTDRVISAMAVTTRVGITMILMTRLARICNLRIKARAGIRIVRNITWLINRGKMTLDAQTVIGVVAVLSC